MGWKRPGTKRGAHKKETGEELSQRSYITCTLDPQDPWLVMPETGRYMPLETRHRKLIFGAGELFRRHDVGSASAISGINLETCTCCMPPQVLTNLDEYGNTSAGSIPLALDEAVRSGKVRKRVCDEGMRVCELCFCA